MTSMGTVSEKRAWHGKGWDAGLASRPHLPENEVPREHWATYIQGYRLGKERRTALLGRFSHE